MSTLLRLIPFLAAAVTIAACGSSSSSSGEAAVDATPAAATTAEPERSEPVTVRGRLGDTLALTGSDLHEDVTKVRVTLKRLKGPFKGYDLPAGRKLVGVELKFANDGDGVYDDPQPRGELTLTGGKRGKQTNLIQLDGSKSPCENPSVKLRTGQSRTVCLAFEVPKAARAERFEFVTDSGYGDTGVWTLG